MADLIDREELLKEMTALYSHHLEMRNFSADGAVCDCIDLVQAAPSCEVKAEDWIDVQSRLPTDDEVYLVRLNYYGAQMRHGTYDTDRISIHGGWVRWQGYVTHWKPLPKIL